MSLTPHDTVAILARQAGTVAAMHDTLIGRLRQLGHTVVCLAARSDPNAAARIEAAGGRLLIFGSGGSDDAGRPGMLTRLAELRQVVADLRKIQPARVLTAADLSPRAGVLAASFARVPSTCAIIARTTGSSQYLAAGRGHGEKSGVGTRSGAEKTSATGAVRLRPSDADGLLARSLSLPDELAKFVGMTSRIGLANYEALIFLDGALRDQIARTRLNDGRQRHVVACGPGVELSAVAASPLPEPSGCLRVAVLAPRLEKGSIDWLISALDVSAECGNQIAVSVRADMDASDFARLRGRSDVEIVRIGEADEGALLDGAHVYLMPATGEVIPTALHMALAKGRPVIVPDQPVYRLAVDTCVNGMAVGTGDRQALAEAMALLCRNPSMLPSLARASRQKAERLFERRTFDDAVLTVLGAPLKSAARGFVPTAVRA